MHMYLNKMRETTEANLGFSYISCGGIFQIQAKVFPKS